MSFVNSAKGMKGMIIGSPSGRPVFRVSTSPGEFKDYYIGHHDFEVEILDDDAFLYESANEYGEGIFDYSPQTLGLDKHVQDNPADALTSSDPVTRKYAEEILKKDKDNE